MGCDRILAWPETGPAFAERPVEEFPYPKVLFATYDRWWHYSSELIRDSCIDYRVELDLFARAPGSLVEESIGHYFVHVCNRCDDAQGISWKSATSLFDTTDDESGRADQFVNANFSGIMLSFALSTSDAHARRRTVGCPVMGCSGVSSHAPNPVSDRSMNEWRLEPEALTTLHAVVGEWGAVLAQDSLGQLPADHPYAQDPFDLDDARGIGFILPRFGRSDPPWERGYAVECLRAGLPMPLSCGSHTLPDDAAEYETSWHEEPMLQLPNALKDHAKRS